MSVKFKALCWGSGDSSVCVNSIKESNLSLLLDRAGLPTIQSWGDSQVQDFFLINKILDGGRDSVIIDRLDLGKYKFGYVVDNPYKFSIIPSSFEIAFDCAVERLLCLPHRFIFIFWSGGIDSTGVLVGIMKKYDHSKIRIVCDKNSQKENPEFYKKYIKGKLETVGIDQYFEMETQEDLVVTGVAGDAVFGDLIDHQGSIKANLELLLLDWRKDNPLGLNDDELNILNIFCLDCDLKIETVYQLRCWFFQRLMLQGRCLERDWWFNNHLGGKVIHFYDFAEEIARWILANPTELIQSELSSYKLPLKNYIYQYDKDRLYFTHKQKEASDSIGIKARRRTFLEVPLVMDQDRKWHNLPSSPIRDHSEFLEWNKQHQWLPINDLL